MKQTTVRFKTQEGLEYTRQGAVPSSVIINQAKEEFENIEVVSIQEGIEIPDTSLADMEGLVNVLEAASANIIVVLDQLVSAEHVTELAEVKQQLQEAKDAIDAELENIRG